jgi:glycosyltransferase involved in cell wall biosynthesis
MGERINLVIIPYNDLLKGEIFGFRDRDLHLINEIIKDVRLNRIMIIERPASFVTLFQFGRYRIKMGRRISKNLVQINERTFVFESFSPGFSQVLIKHLWFERIYSSDKFVEKLKSTMASIGIDEFILLSFNPFACNLVSKLNPSAFFFDVMDNLSAHPDMPGLKDYFLESYRWVSKNADLIFCPTENLRRFFIDNFKIDDECVVVVPNGAPSIRDSSSVDDFLNSLTGPIVGYIGMISGRIDFELVEFLLENKPGVNFVFVGKIYGRAKRLTRRLRRKFKNIFFIGDKHYSLIWKYINAFDVCVIPHIVNNFTSGNDPMKLYEYLLAGKPVISTQVGIPDCLRRYVFIAGDKDEFLSHLDKALKLSGSLEFSERQKKAIDGSKLWSSRARFVIDKMIEVIKLR